MVSSQASEGSLLFSNSVISSHLEECPKCQSNDCTSYDTEFVCFSCHYRSKLNVKTIVKKNVPLELGSEITNLSLEECLKVLDYPEKSLNSLTRCGKDSGFKIIKNCGCGSKVISLTHHCSLRTCSNCSKIRKRRIINKYLPFLEGLYQNRKYFLYFLTVSPKNYENLEEGLKNIKESLSKFLRHNYIKERIKAGLYVIEVKGTEGNWNVHIHAIIYGRWIDNKVRNEKDSKLVKLFMQSSKREVNIHIKKQNSTRFTLNYMCKYISANKDDFQTSLDMAKYIIVTRKKRLIHTFGEFYNIEIKSKKQICSHCNQEIEYVIDFEVVCHIEESMNKPDPPPDLYSWLDKK